MEHTEFGATVRNMRRHFEACKTDATFKDSPYYTKFGGSWGWEENAIAEGNAILARAYLAEHPGDDETTIDDAWLRSVGFETVGLMRHEERWLKARMLNGDPEERCKRTLQIDIAIDGFISVNLFDSLGKCIELKSGDVSRGWLRRLCYVLGIGVKSEAAPKVA